MRRCDDISNDTTLSLPERRQKLDAWLDALHCAQQGQPTDDAILLALTDAQRHFSIPAGLLDELAAGTAMDIEDSELAETSGLRVRSRKHSRICGSIAIASPRSSVWSAFTSLGIAIPQLKYLAERCGLAFQLTNIIRDVKEDASMGRVYLPEEDLTKFGFLRS